MCEHICVFVVCVCKWSQWWSDTHGAMSAFENSRRRVEDKRQRERKKEKKEEGAEGQSQIYLQNHAFAILSWFYTCLTKRHLQDDYQSADTNLTDFKLPFTMIRKRVRNLNYDRLRSILKLFFFVVVFVQPASVKLRWILNGWFISTLTTHTLI